MSQFLDGIVEIRPFAGFFMVFFLPYYFSNYSGFQIVLQNLVTILGGEVWHYRPTDI